VNAVVHECFAVQMIQVCVSLLPSRPLLILSKPVTCENTVLGVAYVPKVSLLFFCNSCLSVLC